MGGFVGRGVSPLGADSELGAARACDTAIGGTGGAIGAAGRGSLGELWPGLHALEPPLDQLTYGHTPANIHIADGNLFLG